ncbi:HAMP domain-containing sensor histidine kinase [Deinococcus sp. YIM 77859]|uniref:GAF domain-containing sensor histidine kinase n=1 Tax=Deinococcus sp. YIM 77859 TaxID=1540221 RepID=UPI00054D09D5|nr:HAMP domain-containing sensor histidine kinase [Deinococcus sp. YIM 77859]
MADIFHGWFADGAQPFPAVMRLEEYEGPILDDLRAGRTVRIEDTRDPALARPDLAAIAEVGVTALLSVPLIVGGTLVVNLSVHQHAARRWTEGEVALVQEVAERLWADLVRARAEAALRALNASLEERVEERTRRLADLNAELGALITRTARNLEAPVGYLSRFLGPGRPADLLAELPPHGPSALEDELARLRGVVQDLRQLARLEDQGLNTELLPLGELFAEVQAGAGSRAEWLIQPLPIVRGDRGLLKQALAVLLTFTLSDTRGARSVDVSSEEIDGEVWVTVQDDGLGLSGEEAATLFDLAVRTEQAVPLLPGSGLVQVRRILARHGGWAWAEARLNGGRVVLAFPRDESVSELEALFRQEGR